MYVILVIVICLIINICFENWKDVIIGISRELALPYLLFFCSYFFQIVTFLCLLSSLIYIIYNVVLIQNNKQLVKKAVVKDIEIEVFDESNDSFFDKYLNEVLYIFINSKINTFVFEDMDRYNDNYIFEKLKEINTLVNNKVNNRVIRFVYLLKKMIHLFQKIGLSF